MIADRGTLRQRFEEAGAADAGLYGMQGRSAPGGTIGDGDLVRELAEEAERLLAEPIPAPTKELYERFERTGNRLAYEGVYFARRRRLTTFGLLAILFPEREDYARALEAILSSIMDEDTWCLPAHMRGETTARGIDLFAAETGFAFAELMTLTRKLLPAPLRARMRAEVDRRLFVPYLTMGPYHWETAAHNWAAVCAGSIGAAALLLERDVGRLAALTEKALGSMACYLSGFGDDGACLEGIGYWNYGFGYFVYYADLLLRRTGGAVDLFADPKVERIALFQQRSYLFGDRTANFSDSAERSPAHRGLSAYLAARYPSVVPPPAAIFAALKDDHCSRFAPALRDLLWHRPRSGEAERGEWPPGSAYLPDAQWLVSRHESAGGRFGFAAKGGHNDEPHNHLDLGQYLLVADGEPAFAADLGRGEYTAQYFGEGRYGYDCNGARGHSLPVVGGAAQRPGAAYRARVLEAEATPEADTMAMELAGAYAAPALVSLVRRLAFRKTELPTLTVQDDFVLSERVGPIEEIVITRSEPVVVAPGELLLQGRRLNVRLTYDPRRLEATVERRSFAGHDGSEERYWRIVLRADGSDELRFGLKLRFAFEPATKKGREAAHVRMG